jgi:hypothetical protein
MRFGDVPLEGCVSGMARKVTVQIYEDGGLFVTGGSGEPGFNPGFECNSYFNGSEFNPYPSNVRTTRRRSWTTSTKAGTRTGVPEYSVSSASSVGSGSSSLVTNLGACAALLSLKLSLRISQRR